MTILSVLGTIAATALASGSIAAVVTHLLTSDRERRGILRQKAEDLYVSVEAFEMSWGLGLISLKSVVANAIDYNQHLDAIIAQGKSTDGSLNRRVHMLTEIYFPSARPELQAVLTALHEFNDVSAMHKEAYREGVIDAFEWRRDFAPRVLRVTKSFEAYKKAVVQCAQSSFAPLKLRRRR